LTGRRLWASPGQTPLPYVFTRQAGCTYAPPARCPKLDLRQLG